MKVLVTGGMGYIGSHTCIQMIEAGMTPVILDNLYNSKSTVLERIEKVRGVKLLLSKRIFAIRPRLLRH